MHTTTDFIALLNTYNIDLCDKDKPGVAGIIDIPMPGRFFGGRDASGRVFINLPVVIRDGSRYDHHETLVIYQRYVNRDDIFHLATTTRMISACSLLGPHYNELTNLDRLLDGRKLSLMAHDIAGLVVPNKQIKIWLDLPSICQVVVAVFHELFAA